MVYTIPSRNAPNASAGNQLGQSLSQGFQQSFQPAVQQQYQRGQLQKALGDLRQQGQNPNASPTDLLYNLIEASSYSPEIGRNLPQLYQALNQAREARAMQNVDYGQANERNQITQQSNELKPGGISPPPRKVNADVERAIHENKFFPNNLGAQQAPGNLPQEATGGQVRPVLSGDELLQKTQQRQIDLGKNGIIKPFDEVYNQVSNENERNIVFNQTVEAERQKRIQSQEKYGALAEERLRKFVPDASDEEAAVFKKIGEDAAGLDKSQADIDRLISKEASQYKNALSNIEKTLESPRIQNRLQRAFAGKSSDMASIENDARSQIKPLLEKGLYEKAGTMLANAGFYPEERERIIFGEMPVDIRKQINSIPKAVFKKTESVPITSMAGIPTGNKDLKKEYDLKSQLQLYDNLSKVFSKGNNDNVNLLELRKEYEDKGYDWRIFKDSMNEMVNNGHIKLNPYQENIFNSNLNEPPLSKMGEILHGLGLRGR